MPLSKTLKIKNAIGPVAQIGLDIPINPRWSAVIDVKKVWFDTQAKGSLPAMGDALYVPILILIHW